MQFNDFDSQLNRNSVDLSSPVSGSILPGRIFVEVWFEGLELREAWLARGLLSHRQAIVLGDTNETREMSLM